MIIAIEKSSRSRAIYSLAPRDEKNACVCLINREFEA